MQPKLFTLKNGMRTVLVPCEAESAAFGIFVASGSRHEPPELAGISHFIEHMLFKGSPTRKPIDITRAIEGRGGNFNAWTSEEATCFFAHLPSEYLGEAVDILGDMYLNAALPPDEFAREKRVVIEEIRMYQDEPDSVAAENLQRAIFPRNALGAPVAGSAATLEGITPQIMHAYISSHYLPEKTVLVVAGAFDEVEALKMLEKRFPRRRVPKAAFAAQPVDFSVPPVAEVSVSKPEINQSQLALGYRTFGVCDTRKYAATVLDAVLGRGMSSRLFQEVREKRGLSYDISSRWQFFADAGMFQVAAGLDPANVDKALATIDREIRRVCEKRVSRAELERMKEFLIGNFRLSHEKVLSKLLYYGSTMLSFGRLVMTAEQVDGVRAVTAEDVMGVAHATFTAANRTVSRVVPRA